MGGTPAENRLEAIRWLRGLEGRFSLKRPVFFVPGISNEDAAMWDSFFSWGESVVGQWGSFAHRVLFPTGTSPAATFSDLGSSVRQQVAAVLSGMPNPAQAVDIVCYSMGGLDTFAALVDLTGNAGGQAPMPHVHHWIALDTPFHGFPNWDLRLKGGDMSDPAFPGRPTQCRAMAPESPLINSLLKNRTALAGKCDVLTCYSAGGETDIQVPRWSSNLCDDIKPGELWGTSPTYTWNLIDGAVHTGDYGIYAVEYVIASALGLLLFDK